MLQVRAAVFSMIQARTGGASRLPEGSRWLDLFAGTGSIGLEVRFEMYVHDFKIPLSMVLYRGAAAGWSSCRSVGQGARPDMMRGGGGGGGGAFM